MPNFPIPRRLFLAGLGTALIASPRGVFATGGFGPLVDPATLAAGHEGVTVIDIRSRKAFNEGHIPLALNAPYGSWRGPSDNPGRALDDGTLTDRLQSLGLNRDSRVVVAHKGSDATNFGAAARVYWTLKSAGLTDISILNGGVEGWVRAGGKLTTASPAIRRSDESFTLSDTWRIDREGVSDVVSGKREAIMVDARPLPFFNGQEKHKLASTAGTLDGALQLTHDSWFTGSKTEIVSGPQVLEIARKAGYKAGGPELVSFCNTGHWAATNWFALSELAGIEGVRLYPESMVGWSNAGGAVVDGEGG